MRKASARRFAGSSGPPGGHTRAKRDAKKAIFEAEESGECGVERFAWKARILPGKVEEYRRRHDEIWPEMSQELSAAGIRNYSIWNIGDGLFGYYECDSIERAARMQANSDVVRRWNEYMKDVMVMEIDPATGTAYQLRQVFFHA
jgi:L-rhamnose mutarotase